jgi:hypothetical protein
MMFEVGYNGTWGRHLMNGGTDTNQAHACPDPYNCTPLASRLPFPNYGYIYMQSNRGTSTYNALYLHLDKHYSKGLDLVASYTWSKSLDQFSSNGNGGANQDQFCQKCDTGYSDFNRTNWLSVGYIYKLPFGAGQKFVSQGVASKIVSNWQWSGITAFSSGTPDSIYMPTSWPDVGPTPTPRADRVCDGKKGWHSTMNEFFDTSCYPAPPPNSFGNAARNSLIGPGSQSWDMSLAREFKIWERLKLSARGEFFSVFNHQNWGFPDDYEPDPQFGKIFGKSGPRIIQVALRMTF